MQQTYLVTGTSEKIVWPMRMYDPYLESNISSLSIIQIFSPEHFGHFLVCFIIKLSYPFIDIIGTREEIVKNPSSYSCILLTNELWIITFIYFLTFLPGLIGNTGVTIECFTIICASYNGRYSSIFSAEIIIILCAGEISMCALGYCSARNDSTNKSDNASCDTCA